MPLLFLSEISKALDTGSIMIFKDAIKKLKTGQLSGIDVFANDVRYFAIDQIVIFMEFRY
jgi:hypothetical protein